MPSKILRKTAESETESDASIKTDKSITKIDFLDGALRGVIVVYRGRTNVKFGTNVEGGWSMRVL